MEKVERFNQLIESIKDGNVDTVRGLCSPDLMQMTDWLYNSAIDIAIRSDNLKMVQICVENGAKVMSRYTWDGRTHLHSAACRSNLKMVQYFLNAGIPVDVLDNNDETPLMCATFPSTDTRACIEYLIDAGADPHAVDKNGLNCLHYAAFSDNKDIIDCFIKRGVDINLKNIDNGRTPLYFVLSGNNSESVTYFLENGADIDVVDKDGMTLLHCAVEWNATEAILCLLEHGCDIHVTDLYGKTPLHCAVNPNNLEIIWCLLKNGILIDATDNYGKTPLHYAAERNDFETFTCLLKAGADKSVIDLYEKSVLEYVDDGSICKALLSYFEFKVDEADCCESFMCELCEDAPKNCVLIPCGHVMCIYCAYEVEECSFCGQDKDEYQWFIL